MFHRYGVYVFAIVPMFLWGLSFVWTKIIYEYLHPFTTVFFRLGIASIFLTCVIFFSNKSFVIAKSDIKNFFILAFFEPFCYFLGEAYGLRYVSSTIASIIIATIPIITPFFAYFFYRERISRMNFIGLIVSFLGICILILSKNFSFDVSTKGLALLFFAVISAVLYTLYLKKLSNSYSSIVIINYQNIIGLCYFFPVFLLFEGKYIPHIQVSTELVLTLCSLSIFCSSLAFIFLAITIRNLGVSKTSAFTNIIPIFTSIFSYLLLGEAFTGKKIIGIFIVIAGLFISQYRKKSSNFVPIAGVHALREK